MKSQLLKKGFLCLSLLVLSAFTVIAAPSSGSAARNQVAVYLGAAKLGLSPSKMTQQQLKQALAVGNQELNSAAFGKGPSALALQNATLAALSTPVNAPTLGLSPEQATPAQIAAVATSINPSLANGALTKAAVAASMAYTTDSKGINHPVFGPQPSADSIAKIAAGQLSIDALNAITKSEQIQNASQASGVIVAAALKPFANSKNASNPTAVAIVKDISEGAVAGLGPVNVGSPSSVLYGETSPNVQAVVAELVVASQQMVGIVPTSGSSVSNPLTLAVASGAVAANPALGTGVAAGVALGSYNSYKQQNGGPLTSPQYNEQNNAALVTVLKDAGVPNPQPVLAQVVTETLGTLSNNGQNNGNGSTTGIAGGNNTTGIPGGGGAAGIPGLGSFGITQGGSSPVTNTQGG